MAENDGKAPQGDTPAPYCKLSRAEAVRLAELGLSGMQCALYLVYASERRQVKGEIGVYRAECADGHAAELLGVDRRRVQRLRSDMAAKGAIITVRKPDGRSKTRVYFPPQYEAVAAQLAECGEEPADMVEHLRQSAEKERVTITGDLGGISLNAPDASILTRANSDASETAESMPQGRQFKRPRCGTNRRPRSVESGAPDAQNHEQMRACIRSGIQIGYTTDDLYPHEGDKAGERSAASACAAARPGLVPGADEEGNPAASMNDPLPVRWRHPGWREYGPVLCSDCGARAVGWANYLGTDRKRVHTLKCPDCQNSAILFEVRNGFVETKDLERNGFEAVYEPGVKFPNAHEE